MLGQPSRPARPLSCEYPSRLLGASQCTTLRPTPPQFPAELAFITHACRLQRWHACIRGVPVQALCGACKPSDWCHIEMHDRHVQEEGCRGHQRTSALSTPMPKAIVATTMRRAPSRHCACTRARRSPSLPAWYLPRRQQQGPWSGAIRSCCSLSRAVYWLAKSRSQVVADTQTYLLAPTPPCTQESSQTSGEQPPAGRQERQRISRGGIEVGVAQRRGEAVTGDAQVSVHNTAAGLAAQECH